MRSVDMHSEHSEKIIAYSVAGSVLFHVLLFFFYLNFVLLRPETKNIVISNVDLLVQEKEARVPKPAASKTLDFLKLALPKIPKIEMAPPPRMPSIEIKAPEARRKNFDLPQKLIERSGRAQAAEKLEMDTGKRVTSVKEMDLGLKAERSSMALAPKIELEEVGMKKAPSIPENLRFDEGARSFKPQTMQELNIAVDRAKKVSALTQGLSEREGNIAALRQTERIGPAMPERLAEARTAPAESVSQNLRAKPVITASSLGPRGAKAIKQGGEEKKVDIEGPLSRRRVLKYHVPVFPDWAKERGILEASVAIKFYVDNAGQVLDNASVERSSGYGAIDRLAMDAIKQWQFEPMSGAMSRQWGIITFRFVTD